MLDYILFAYPIALWAFVLRMRSVNKWRSRLLDAISRDLSLRIHTTRTVTTDHVHKMYDAADIASFWQLMFSLKPFRKHFEGSLLDQYNILEDMED